jgi:hypothetical protein
VSEKRGRATLHEISKFINILSENDSNFSIQAFFFEKNQFENSTKTVVPFSLSIFL